MLPRKTGRIINISSEGGKTWNYGLSVYNSCKSGIIGFTRNLAHELADTGVTAVAVCPGVMVTDQVIQSIADTPEEALEAIASSMRRLSAGRASLPEEVANMIAFLATEAGAYVQGTAISVGGGLTD